MIANKAFQWRGQDLNLRPRGYEPRELPGCSTPRQGVGIDMGSISVVRQKGSHSFSEFAPSRLLFEKSKALAVKITRP